MLTLLVITVICRECALAGCFYATNLPMAAGENQPAWLNLAHLHDDLVLMLNNVH